MKESGPLGGRTPGAPPLNPPMNINWVTVLNYDCKNNLMLWLGVVVDFSCNDPKFLSSVFLWMYTQDKILSLSELLSL